MDALTHAVEAFIGNSTTYATRKDALMAVQLIFENLDTAYHDGKNVNARRNMLHASYYAGCAFTKSYVGYVHAVAHSLGGQYKCAAWTCQCNPASSCSGRIRRIHSQKTEKLAIAAGIATKETPAPQAAAAFIDAIKEMKRTFGIGNTVAEIQETDIPKNLPTMRTKRRIRSIPFRS